MELVSLIVMALGLVALVGIYMLSRLSRRQLPQKRDENVPVLRDAEGQELTSIQEDMPARDGKRPAAAAWGAADSMASGIGARAATTDKPTLALPPQLVLFVAADSEAGFAGEAVLQALHNAGLTFGEMGVFHRMVLGPEGETSLFSVANGVKPWTLVPEELVHQTTPGLSLILNLPSPAGNAEAIHDFVRTAERLAAELGGVLQDQHQNPFDDAAREDLLALAAA